MTHVITDACIGTKDTSCVAVCPVDCIHPTKDEFAFEEEAMLFIDPNVCIDCGLCVDVCPVTAIYSEDALPDELTKFLQINAEYFKTH